jgi:hypothetical protein|nr:MAG TPA: hypothetical protein [Caudoviricetes sp.]
MNAWAQKKMPSRTAMRKGHIEKYPFKVYHIVKPKGNRTMIELKITVDKAVELEQEVKDLYQSIVGTPVKEVENWTTNDVKPAKKEAPKVETPAPKAEEPKVEVPSLEATREAVKDVMAKATDKTKAKGEFKAFLDSIGAEKVTSATDEQRIQIMEWVNSRG